MAAQKKWDLTSSFIIDATFDAASAAAGVSTQNVTVSTTDSTAPLMAGDTVIAVIPPAALLTGLFIKSARYLSATQIAVTFDNNTVSAIDAASGVWRFVIGRGPDA